MVLDATTGIGPRDRVIMDGLAGRRAVCLVNKTDIADEGTVGGMIHSLENEGRHAIAFSAVTGKGLGDLEKAISDMVKNEFVDYQDSFIADVRVITLLEKSMSHLDSITGLITDAEPLEITAFVFQNLIEDISAITGEIYPDEILNSIFSRFCIGK